MTSHDCTLTIGEPTPYTHTDEDTRFLRGAKFEHLMGWRRLVEGSGGGSRGGVVVVEVEVVVVVVSSSINH